MTPIQEQLAFVLKDRDALCRMADACDFAYHRAKGTPEAHIPTGPDVLTDAELWRRQVAPSLACICAALDAAARITCLRTGNTVATDDAFVAALQNLGAGALDDEMQKSFARRSTNTTWLVAQMFGGTSGDPVTALADPDIRPFDGLSAEDQAKDDVQVQAAAAALVEELVRLGVELD